MENDDAYRCFRILVMKSLCDWDKIIDSIKILIKKYPSFFDGIDLST